MEARNRYRQGLVVGLLIVLFGAWLCFPIYYRYITLTFLPVVGEMEWVVHPGEIIEDDGWHMVSVRYAKHRPCEDLGARIYWRDPSGYKVRVPVRAMEYGPPVDSDVPIGSGRYLATFQLATSWDADELAVVVANRCEPFDTVIQTQVWP